MPPGAEEQELYYYGLPSCPKLVARTSSNVWVNPQMPGPTTFTGTLNMYRKMLRPAGRHPLLNQLWNDATSSLRVQITDAVSDIDWHAIDILRVGYVHEQSPITLMVAVTPDTVSWNQAYPVAVRCKSILEQHGIHGIECEVRESVVAFLTEPDEKKATFQLSSKFPELFTAEHEDGVEHAQLTDHLGTRIAIKDMPNHGVEAYRRPEFGPFKDIIQVDQHTFESRLKGYEARTADETKKGSSALLLRDTMRPFTAASSRVIGEVLYSPEFSCTTTEGGREWLRDWALVELQPASHEAPLDSIKNRIFIGSRQQLRFLINKGEPGWKGLADPVPPDMDDGCFNLSKEVVPYEELFNPPGTAAYMDEPAICVAKFGATSNLTMGLGNTLKSVVRTTTETPDGERKNVSEEWPIISVPRARDRSATFCEPGDSGSCVWDMDGRPAGIIMAGNGINRINDVTYASPLERLLADIKSHGFDVSLV
ncbi:hypothetical protein BBK36DRAFT_1170516 [Trichoderma citrinoviride]|uniref:Peptidase S64 n=1 Tax=Trichoderma citrinoviride TaxID=58853 RepID=A0A2T4B692_9HYPO|nr:hypothetical protein BBK36DRAFT_1170516 [Trichoderma citrinoviride]PTB64844.1 hypothetical protein BBK36DRAFT_1170516 [Trichoderma citrinoviride]